MSAEEEVVTPEETTPPVGEDVPPVVEDVVIEEESSSTVMIVTIVLGALVAIGIMYYMNMKKKKEEEEKKKKAASSSAGAGLPDNTVGLKDIEYIAKHLSPDSTHLDILLAVASTPDAIAYGLRAYHATEKLRADRIENDKKEASKNKSKSKSSSTSDMFDLGDDGWDDGEDEDLDEEAKKKAELAKAADEQKKKDREQLAKATGKAVIMLEGVDDGVIGQKWVENTLASKGSWPPKNMSFLADQKFEYEGKMVAPLDHPGLRRNLCMITGRLNASVLNSHPELLEAGSKQLVDQTYFKGSMEFRGRCALLLEAALRTAVALKSKKLTGTIVETVAIFKIGCYSGQTEWFNNIMQKQYQCLPRLEIKDPTVETPDEKEVATGDTAFMTIEMTRLHAESFTRQKIAMFQRQGIPPQVALQTYREGWWFLIHGERLSGPGDISKGEVEIKTDGLLQAVDSAIVGKFDEAPFTERLLSAWPMVVQNVAQKSGKVKIMFPIPSVPGKYKFTVDVKSQDFLGADKDFSVEVDVVDAKTVTRKPKEKKVAAGGEKAAEVKKAE